MNAVHNRLNPPAVSSNLSDGSDVYDDATDLRAHSKSPGGSPPNDRPHTAAASPARNAMKSLAVNSDNEDSNVLAETRIYNSVTSQLPSGTSIGRSNPNMVLTTPANNTAQLTTATAVSNDITSLISTEIGPVLTPTPCITCPLCKAVLDTPEDYHEHNLRSHSMEELSRALLGSRVLIESSNQRVGLYHHRSHPADPPSESPPRDALLEERLLDAPDESVPIETRAKSSHIDSTVNRALGSLVDDVTESVGVGYLDATACSLPTPDHREMSAAEALNELGIPIGGGLCVPHESIDQSCHGEDYAALRCHNLYQNSTVDQKCISMGPMSNSFEPQQEVMNHYTDRLAQNPNGMNFDQNIGFSNQPLHHQSNSRTLGHNQVHTETFRQSTGSLETLGHSDACPDSLSHGNECPGALPQKITLPDTVDQTNACPNTLGQVDVHSGSLGHCQVSTGSLEEPGPAMETLEPDGPGPLVGGGGLHCPLRAKIVPQKIMSQMMWLGDEGEDDWPELGDDITLIDDEQLLSSLDLFPSVLDDLVIELEALEESGALTVQKTDQTSPDDDCYSHHVPAGSCYPLSAAMDGAQGSSDMMAETGKLTGVSQRFLSGSGVKRGSDGTEDDTLARDHRPAPEKRLTETALYGGGPEYRSREPHVPTEDINLCSQAFTDKPSQYGIRDLVLEREKFAHEEIAQDFREAENSHTDITLLDDRRTFPGQHCKKMANSHDFPENDSIVVSSAYVDFISQGGKQLGFVSSDANTLIDHPTELQNVPREQLKPHRRVSFFSGKTIYSIEPSYLTTMAPTKLFESGSCVTDLPRPIMKAMADPEHCDDISNTVTCTAVPSDDSVAGTATTNNIDADHHVLVKRVDSSVPVELTASRTDSPLRRKRKRISPRKSSLARTTGKEEVLDHAERLQYQEISGASIKSTSSMTRSGRIIKVKKSTEFVYSNSSEDDLNDRRIGASVHKRPNSAGRRIKLHESMMGTVVLKNKGSFITKSEPEVDVISFPIRKNSAISIKRCPTLVNILSMPALQSHSPDARDRTAEENDPVHQNSSSGSVRGEAAIARGITCHLCLEVFTLQRHLDTHFNTAHAHWERCYSCRCGAQFDTEEEFRQHWLHRHRDLRQVTYTCQVCDETFERENSYDSHLKVIHPEYRISCYVCGKRFISSKNLKIHFATHTKRQIFPCPYCQKTFWVRYSFNRHFRNHFRRFECESCSKSFKQKQNYEAHRLKHELGASLGRGTKLRCNSCGDLQERTFVAEQSQFDSGHHKACIACNEGLYTEYSLLQSSPRVCISKPQSASPVLQKPPSSSGEKLKSIMNPLPKLHLKQSVLVSVGSSFESKVTFSTSSATDQDRSSFFIAPKPSSCEDVSPGREKVECPHCSTSVLDVAKHIKRVHRQPKVRCDVCHALLKKDSLQAHKDRLHGRLSIGGVLCNHCGKRYSNALAVRDHMARVRRNISSVLEYMDS